MVWWRVVFWIWISDVHGKCRLAIPSKHRYLKNMTIHSHRDRNVWQSWRPLFRKVLFMKRSPSILTRLWRFLETVCEKFGFRWRIVGRPGINEVTFLNLFGIVLTGSKGLLTRRFQWRFYGMKSPLFRTCSKFRCDIASPWNRRKNRPCERVLRHQCINNISTFVKINWENVCMPNKADSLLVSFAAVCIYRKL